MIFGEDDFTRQQEIDYGQALWRVLLSDGRVIVQDDHRPGMWHHSAWVRLGHFVAESGLAIRQLRLQFRGNHPQDALPANAEGYFFTKGYAQLIGDSEGLRFYKLGALLFGKLVVHSYRVPDLTLLEIEQREPATAGPCLIRNPRVA